MKPNRSTKTIILMLAASMGLLSTSVSAQCPNGVRVRREWRDLSDADKQRFVSAISKLHRERDGFNAFVGLHNQMQQLWHEGSHFFPSHRLMLLKFEEELRKIDPGVPFPYWDWTLDANDISKSPIWDYFGRGKPGECLKDGTFADWQVTNTSPHCLVRDIDLNVQHRFSTNTQDMKRTIESSSTYSDFHSAIEYGSHRDIHVLLGGDMGKTISPNDPIFYIHHVMVDKLWDDWQRSKTENFYQMEGKQPGVTEQASLDDHISFYNAPIRDLMDITKLCYSYPGTNSHPAPDPPQHTNPPSPGATGTASATAAASKGDKSTKTSTPKSTSPPRKSNDPKDDRFNTPDNDDNNSGGSPSSHFASSLRNLLIAALLSLILLVA